MNDLTQEKKQVSIWWFAFGYFAAYVPYSFMTKLLTGGLVGGLKHDTAVGSFEILPVTVMASVISMLIFITSMNWWQFAAHSNISIGSKTFNIPHPTRWTLLSGICTGLVVVTTTLAYTIQGVSIVFAMLLMRGGMLIMSPIIDKISGRHVRWFSWCALSMAVLALVVSNLWPEVFGNASEEQRSFFNAALILDVAVYLTAYFVRLKFMTKLAKSDDPNVTKKYFVEEQMVGTPFILLVIFIISLFSPEIVDPLRPQGLLEGLHAGFTSFFSRGSTVIIIGIVTGICSQFTGVFGGLILLDKSENAFAVPVNRCSSILAGVVATSMLIIIFPDIFSVGAKEVGQFVGAALIIGSILFLTIPPLMAKKKARV